MERRYLALSGDRLLDDGMLHGPESSGGTGGYSNLVADVLDMMIGGFRGDDRWGRSCSPRFPASRWSKYAGMVDDNPT
jgi:hypothetical protein